MNMTIYVSKILLLKNAASFHNRVMQSNAVSNCFLIALLLTEPKITSQVVFLPIN